MIMKVQGFRVDRMRQQQAFEFYNKVIEAVKISPLEELLPYRIQLEEANHSFDMALKPIRKSIWTQEIREEDQNRANAWSGLNGMVKNACKHFDPSIKAIAQKAKIIVKTYGNPTRLPYTEETGTLKNLITDLQQELSRQEQEKIGMKVWLDELERSNTEFAKKIAIRQNEIAYLESGKSQEKRKEVDNAYKALVKFINAYIVIHSSRGLTDCIVHLNHLIDQESAVIKARKTRNTPHPP
ncbi:MAG: DUF6261 family protein [Tannerellaceae bacterium]|nr:DUF6261 family protein [Tannerellaceae bacterium]